MQGLVLQASRQTWQRGVSVSAQAPRWRLPEPLPGTIREADYAVAQIVDRL